MSGLRAGGVRTCGAVALGLLALTGCILQQRADDRPTAPPPSGSGGAPPCSSGTTVDLGSPLVGGRVARLRLVQGPAYLTATHIDPGVFSGSRRGRVAVYLGPAGTPPSFDEGTGQVTGATITLTAVEGEPVQVPVDPGDYWVWSSGNADLRVTSCVPSGVVAPPG